MRSLSNVLKSDRIYICEERKFIFSTRRNVVAYPSVVEQSNEEQKLQKDLEEIKKQAEQEARKIVESAEKHAKNIIVDAGSRAQEVLEEACKQGYEDGYEQGYAKGLSEGRNKGESEYRDLLKQANDKKMEYEKLKETLYRSSEQDMVRLAVDIARKIIDIRMEDDEKLYLRIADKVLAEINGQKNIQLRCSSQDYPIAVANKEYLISRLDGVEDINIIEDIFLDKGSCIVETDGGGVDGSVDTQIEKIKNVFKTILLESAEKEVRQ